MQQDYYKTLGVERTASADEVRNAYRRLARKHHPDLNPGDKSAEDLFKKVHHTKHASTLEQYSPHIMGAAGNEVWTTGEWNAIFQVENGAPLQAKGYWLDVNVREGDGWKFLVNTFNFNGPPIPVQTK